MPDIIETTQLMAFFGNIYERLPQIKAGVQFHVGDFKIQPEVAVLMSAFGDANLANTPPGISVPANSVAEQLNERFGARIGSDSGQPAVEGRIVFRTRCSGGRAWHPRNLFSAGITPTARKSSCMERWQPPGRKRTCSYRGSLHAPLPIQ